MYLFKYCFCFKGCAKVSKVHAGAFKIGLIKHCFVQHSIIKIGVL